MRIIKFFLPIFFFILTNCNPKQQNTVSEALLPIALRGELQPPSTSIQANSISPVVTPIANENPDFSVGSNGGSSSLPGSFSAQGVSIQTMTATGEVIKVTVNPGTAEAQIYGIVDANGNFIKAGSYFVNSNGDIVDSKGNVDNTKTTYIDYNGNIIKDGKLSGNVNGANLFDNLSIVFGTAMDKASVEANFTLKDSNGNVIPGTFVWSGDQFLQFDPYTQLKEDTIYTISVSKDAKVAAGITNATFEGFTAQFKTGSTFNGAHKSSVNGTEFDLSSATKGSVIQPSSNSNANLSTTVIPLNTSFPYPDRIQAIRFYKLGKRKDEANKYEPYYLSVCDNTNVATTDDCLQKSGNNYLFNPGSLPTGVTISNQTKTSFSIGIANLNAIIPAELKPEIGGNTYYYCINVSGKSVGSEPECNFARTFSFIYGATAPDPEAYVANSLSMALGQNAIDVVEKVVERLATEAFKIEGKTLNEEINVQTTRDTTQTMTAPDGKTCMATRVGNGIDKFPSFPYLSKIGPFCDIKITNQKATLKKKDLYKIYQQSDGALRVALALLFNPVALICCQYKDDDENVAYLTYDADVDAYIKEMKINKTPADIMDAELVPGNGNLVVSLGIRGATGQMLMVLKLVSAKMSFLFDVLPITIPSDLIGGKYQYTTGFAINRGQTNGTHRYANITTTTALSNNKILINTTPPANYSPSDYPAYNFKQWNDNLEVNEISDQPDYSVVDSTSSLAQTIAGFLDPVMKVTVKEATLQKLPDIQPMVVGGTIKDTVEKVVPNLINTILDPFTSQNGYPLAMPSYLPDPFNTLKINVKGTPASVTPKVDGNFKGLEAKINTSLVGTLSKANHPKPSGLQGSSSYILLPNAGIPDTLIKDANASKGDVLIALHPDGVNKALYGLWKEGSFNLTVDKTTIKLVKDIATAAGADTSVITMSESLLNAESILAVFAPAKSEWVVYDSTISTTRKINKADEVFVKTTAILPAVITVKDSTTEKIPELGASVMDLLMEIRGKASDGSDYLISKIRVNTTIKSEFQIKNYTTPKTIKVNINGKDITYSSSQSLRVDVPIPANDEDVSKGVFFSIEMISGADNNPFGLNPQKMENLIKPLVRTLILPLVNNILGDVPLPSLKACGIMASNVGVLAIPPTIDTNGASIGTKFIFAKASLSEDPVPFTGDCSVKTILDLN